MKQVNTEIFVHPYTNRVFTLLSLKDITIELSHTEQHEVLDFVIIVDGAAYQQ